jgi:glycosyltransferase involved in cell wall biosynthesis
MVTRNRPRFFTQALRYFEKQTYTDAELIVVDDGEESVEPLCAGLDRVRYFRCPAPMTTGAKLNFGIERASGDLLQKLDDDDYYAPDFLQTAVDRMPRTGRDVSLVAWCCFLALVPGEERLRLSEHGWMTGNTLLFTRAFWAPAPFRDLARGSDSAFLADRKGYLFRVCAPEQCIVVRHGKNTWTDMKSGESVEDRFRKFRFYEKSLAEVVGVKNAAFYQPLPHGKAAAQ